MAWLASKLELWGWERAKAWIAQGLSSRPFHSHCLIWTELGVKMLPNDSCVQSAWAPLQPSLQISFPSK